MKSKGSAASPQSRPKHGRRSQSTSGLGTKPASPAEVSPTMRDTSNTTRRETKASAGTRSGSMDVTFMPNVSDAITINQGTSYPTLSSWKKNTGKGLSKSYTLYGAFPGNGRVKKSKRKLTSFGSSWNNYD